jgi:N-acetylglucosaminyl-diphospho-decaprenol L-rhamnosyltransferase
MKLSIVILCWNDKKVIGDCLRSIYDQTREFDVEVIVSDNGSTDGSIEFIHQAYPKVQVLENGKNLGFAQGNNVGIDRSTGEYVLILNPDTIIHSQALENLVACADRHPEAGAFGCRVLNPDGSFQNPARPFPTIWRSWIAALYLRPLAHFSNVFISDIYTGWDGRTERVIDWQSGCCVMFRRDVLQALGGFDNQFFYHYEEVDLCLRTWKAGHSIVYTPDAVITHLGGQSVNRFPVRFELEKCRSRYRYFYKHFGSEGARKSRLANLAWFRVRQLGWSLKGLFSRPEGLEGRLEMYRRMTQWNKQIDPARFVQQGEEPKAMEELVSQQS